MQILRDETEPRPLLLSDSGIYDFQGLQVDSPFNDKPVSLFHSTHGKLAIVSDLREVWEYSGNWTKLMTCPAKPMCISYTHDGAVIIGTGKGQLLKGKRSGIEAINSFQSIPERKYWEAPFGGPPEIGSISVQGKHIVVSVRNGWLACSDNNGRDWYSLSNGLEKEVLEVVHGSNESDSLLCATAAGFFKGGNGKAFKKTNLGLGETWCQSVIELAGLDTLLVCTRSGPLDSVNNLLYRKEGTSQQWVKCEGLPEAIRKPILSQQVMSVDQKTVYAVLNEHELYITKNAGKNWDLVRQFDFSIRAICCAKGL